MGLIGLTVLFGRLGTRQNLSTDTAITYPLVLYLIY